jgi:hypothetical protein
MVPDGTISFYLAFSRLGDNPLGSGFAATASTRRSLISADTVYLSLSDRSMARNENLDVTVGGRITKDGM